MGQFEGSVGAQPDNQAGHKGARIFCTPLSLSLFGQYLPACAHFCLAVKLFIFSNKLIAFLEGPDCTVYALQGSHVQCITKDLLNMSITEK